MAAPTDVTKMAAPTNATKMAASAALADIEAKMSELSTAVRHIKVGARRPLHAFYFYRKSYKY